MTKIDKYVKFNSFRLLCLKNAEDALRGAELLIGNNLDHIVFHLSILSMEEVGKIFMTWMRINQVENWDKESMKITIDDHVKKLFYAIWGPTIGNEIVDKKQWEKNMNMASKLHQLRLFSLYGAYEDSVESSKKIPLEDIESTYQFAKSTLELAKIEGMVKEDFDEKHFEQQAWFDNYLQDKANANFAFGDAGQRKLIELDDFNKWIEWLKETKEKENQELMLFADRELNKQSNLKVKEFISKWEIVFTVFTPSHSLRQKELNTFNKHLQFYKFQLGKDRHTLIIKHTLPSIITIDLLWSQGWVTTKLLVAALNVASRGLFYWHASKDIDRYYDFIMDLEIKKRLVVSMSPQLELDWKSHKMYLSEQQLHLTSIVYDYFLQIRTRHQKDDIMAYMAAVAMFARTDIHLRLEIHSFLLFFNVFENLIKKNEQIGEGDNVFDIGFQQIEKVLGGKEQYNTIIALGFEVRKDSQKIHPITLSEVLSIKNYCDWYLLTLAVRVIQNMPGARLIGDNSPEHNSDSE